MADVKAAAPRALPVFRAVGEAYGLVLRRPIALIKIIWFWFLVVLAGSYLVNWIESLALTVVEQVTTEDARSRLYPIGLTAEFVNELIFLLAGCAVAVGWHSVILLQEDVKGIAHVVLSRREIFYCGVAVLFYASVYGAAASVFALYYFGSDALHSLPLSASGSFALKLAGLASLSFLVAYLLSRMILVFPALAVEDGPISLRRFWQRTRGNGWRLFGGLVCCILPVGILIGAVIWPAFDNSSFFVEYAVAREWLAALIVFVTDVITVGFVSVAYRELVLAQDKPA